MKATVYKETKTETLSDLLNEYEEECLNAVRLIKGLKLRTLTEEQTEDMLGELSASITHLRIHSEQLEKLIEETLN
ncbi:MAG: hypothetical protein COZ31_02535 [Nitrospirae bacterium CG_4_10_14_3_um_filter_44_29]|nr:hypothetical protein [Nitrospirota bacterium]PIP71120.1 MAG: hypothetical protein COW90_01790 [Nitrospirae bacterium CG22_combo_CG10-13_8_21_14_all_44_11]PIV40531.1 MAG: hypothetical protein COS28_08450 [Nitrospirae bacterium CG02_land_8_20_14_3_00_44_33]PIV66280.1 MAG: hypothetical protein COS10_07155 [Nitrospirae bacterium CG01_land_8_20_14_3_00_44_22]PIW89281.1 MAG: hypothetical protein COZ93_05930 [Nitrospirae bacterium CG_4_8_14_3_um_filter_44_28]PIX89364.1 MAG: hypothetical protein CO